MRIISGTQKGRRLSAPKNLPVRPTTDMAKEALFNILSNDYYIDDVSVIDLFAGTGNISFEFASRGATNITAVDSHIGCVKYINSTSDQFDFSINTIKSDVYNFLSKTPLKATIIFADPPYDFEIEKFVQVVASVFERELLIGEGVLIVEHSQHTDLSSNEHFSYSKKYGGNMFSFFERVT
ncbi:MAG: RsmD family RNA methyltransferase [Urechidicola sp.]|nr:RsmD family RNA methyltransferase [Urechidicola sp.]